MNLVGMLDKHNTMVKMCANNNCAVYPVFT
jgi:hypothetical protein